MQQPLAHLYFLTVFDDLLNSKFDLSPLIKTTQNIAKVSAHVHGWMTVQCLYTHTFIYHHLMCIFH